MTTGEIPIHDSGFDPGGNGYPQQDEPELDGWQIIFGAADYTTLIKPKSTVVSRTYRDKTYSVLKAATVGSINSGNMADAATFIHHGPSFGIAVGQLADADERARKAIDFLTSPSNPYVVFLMTAIPLISQLVRNHEEALSAIPQNIKMGRRQRKAMRSAQKDVPPRFTMHLFGRDIPVRWNPRVKPLAFLKGFRSQTNDPGDLTNHVFEDPKLLKALADQGILIIKRDTSG